VDAETRLQITQAEAHILAHLASLGALSVGEIYEAFGHKRSTLTSILNRLEDRGLITCTVHESDKRSFLIALTPTGAKLAQRVYESLKDLEAEVLGAFSPADQKNVLRLLTGMTAIAGENTTTT
jgi:DNA-binding MarR family transcriptional regulator